jgi:hypothetical protein
MAPVPEMADSESKSTVSSDVGTVVGSTNVTLLPAVEKGRADWRDYRCLRLDNGVTLCLVHDTMSKTTA